MLIHINVQWSICHSDIVVFWRSPIWPLGEANPLGGTMTVYGWLGLTNHTLDHLNWLVFRPKTWAIWWFQSAVHLISVPNILCRRWNLGIPFSSSQWYTCLALFSLENIIYQHPMDISQSSWQRGLWPGCSRTDNSVHPSITFWTGT